MPKAPPGLEQLLPDYLSVRILRRVSSFHLVSQHERLVNRLDASERCSRDFALARSADYSWLGLNDLRCAPVDMTRDAVS
jgi:hypothetical protein